MQVESKKNKNAKRLNFLKGRQSHNPSQTNGGAKVQINSQLAIPKLQNLARKYIGVTDPHGFLTDLRVALGIPDSQGASKYGVVSIPKEDGSILQASLRITNHQANANTYIDHDANYEYNLSIVVRRKQRKNTFIPNDNVILDEYVYYGSKIQNIENPLTQIVNGIILFLQSGEYKDTTGVAFKNQSVESKDRIPQNISLDNDGNYISANGDGADYVSESFRNNRTKTRYNMYKKLIRLTESDLHRIVKETVDRLLEDTKAQRKKDPMNQWFKDFDAASKHRENMEYIENGGREPNKHRKNVAKALKKVTNEGIENETRFLPHLKRTYENLYREYEHWQYATYKPQGMDDAINAIIEAMHSVKDIIEGIEPNDNIPSWEDPQQY